MRDWCLVGLMAWSLCGRFVFLYWGLVCDVFGPCVCSTDV